MPIKAKPDQFTASMGKVRRRERLSESERKERQSDLLDDALLETFPASDPVSVVEVE
jgi:hypothetical protein